MFFVFYRNSKKTKKKQQITTKKKSENITYFAGIQVVFLTLVFSHVSDFRFRNTLSDFFTQQCQKCESPKIETLTSLKQCQNKRHLKGALLDGIVERDPTTPPAELHTPKAIQWSISHPPTTEAHTHWLTHTHWHLSDSILDVCVCVWWWEGTPRVFYHSIRSGGE